MLFPSLSLFPVSPLRFYDLNYLRWAMDFLSASESRNRVYTCDPSELVLAPPSFAGTCPADLLTTVGQSPSLLPAGATGYTNATILKCPYACGNDLLDQFGINSTPADMALSLSLIALFATIFGVAAFMTISRISHIRR